jgi:peptidoglycan/LPS O-acetylase OafA/YrhL
LSGILSKPNRLFTNQISQFVGRMSYSLYLVHWPVIAIWFSVFFSTPGPVTKILLIFVSFVLAALIHVFVENRVLEGKPK